MGQCVVSNRNLAYAIRIRLSLRRTLQASFSLLKKNSGNRGLECVSGGGVKASPVPTATIRFVPERQCLMVGRGRQKKFPDLAFGVVSAAKESRRHGERSQSYDTSNTVRRSFCVHTYIHVQVSSRGTEVWGVISLFPISLSLFPPSPPSSPSLFLSTSSPSSTPPPPPPSSLPPSCKHQFLPRVLLNRGS